ncbi:MAG: hypothetical protein H0T87_08680 [Gammaproteobacteria bacterium]|nr:hypothetical protein [Gammaproteobacteria bacterium]
MGCGDPDSTPPIRLCKAWPHGLALQGAQERNQVLLLGFGELLAVADYDEERLQSLLHRLAPEFGTQVGESATAAVVPFTPAWDKAG